MLPALLALLTMGAAGARAQAPVAPPPVALRFSAPTLEEGGQVEVEVVLATPLARDGSASFGLVSAKNRHAVLQISFARLSTRSVAMRAGQARASVTLSAREDELLQTVDGIGVSVYVSGLNGPAETFATVAFRDNDPLRLSVRANGDVWREGSPASDLLAISSNLRRRFPDYKLQSSRPDVIQVRDGFLAGVLERPGIDEPTPVTLTASGPDMEPIEVKVVVVDSSSRFLSVRFWPDWVDEDAVAPARGTVFRSGDLSQPLRVALGNSNPRLVNVPPFVTIPARKDRASFEATPIEVREIDPRHTTDLSPAQRIPDAIISASASDPAGVLASGRAVLNVRDTTPLIEGLATPARFLEDLAPTKGTLSLRLLRPRGHDVPVTLAARDARVELASTSAVLPRAGGEVRVAFTVRDDDAAQGSGTYMIEVHDGYIRAHDGEPSAAAVARMRLLDDDAPLSIRLSRSYVLGVERDAVVDVAVLRPSPDPQPLPIRLSTRMWPGGGTVEIDLPTDVTIAANARSASVSLRMKSSADGSANATLQAVGNRVSAQETLSVLGPQNRGVIWAELEVLSSGAPDAVVILKGFGSESMDSSTTLLIVAGENPGMVSAPATIELRSYQEFVAIPIRLLRAPDKDTTVSFTVAAQGKPARDGDGFRVQILADPPAEQ